MTTFPHLTPESRLAAVQSENRYLHHLVTRQAVVIDELIEAMGAGRLVALTTLADLMSGGAS